jgi:hypothetical protein
MTHQRRIGFHDQRQSRTEADCCTCISSVSGAPAVSVQFHSDGDTQRRSHRSPVAFLTAAAPRGDRQANSALWRIALVRMGCHQPTKDYVARRTAEGETKTEIMRRLKRHIAREVFPRPLTGAPAALASGQSRPGRSA